MSHTVLIVDDEINILNAVRRLLRKEPYHLAVANRCDEAFSMIQASPPAVILSDYLMPEMNGLQFILKAKEIAPDTVPMVFSGYADMDALLKALQEGGIYRFIPKPWEDEFFKIEIKRAVEQYDLSQKNRALRDRLEKEFTAEVELLASLPQAQERHTNLHSDRVKEIALSLGKKVGLEDEALKELGIAARLHDFGNLAVPSIILNKPGPLTPEERKEVEKHVLFPEERLKEMTRFENICKIIRSHHEFYNGDGYPDHLRGEAIPLASRILFIAEVYDSLLSDRPFRKALSKPEALVFMKEGRGGRFDPTLIDIFLNETGPA